MSTPQPSVLPANKGVYCNRCKGETQHECLWQGGRSEGEPLGEDYGGGYFVERWTFNLWRCLGCRSVALEESYTNDGMHGNDGEDIWDSSFHPNRTRNKLSKKHFWTLPKELNQIYGESIIAFNGGARLLSAVGLRALIEGVCRAKGVKGDNLSEQIDGLVGHLPANIVKNLHSFRFMGNVATHELTAPEEGELRLAIDICEDLLNFFYQLDYNTARLGRLTERYSKAASKTKTGAQPKK